MDVKLNYLSMLVSDMRRSLDFYRTLGLPIPEGAHLTDSGAAEGHVEIQQGGLRIAWESEAMMRELNPDWQAPSGAGRLGVALELPTPAELDELCDRLQAASHPPITPPFDAVWGQRYATVQDPDGTRLDLFAWLPQG